MGLRDMRYSDRDVREDDELVEAAYEYLEGYQGEFEFLIDCKMRAASGDRLSVGMVRGVLNCMRNDPRVKGMPDPLPPEEGTVTPIRTPYAPKRKRSQMNIKRYMGHKPCGDGQVFVSWHDRHDWEDEEHKYSCPGLYKINRGKSLDGGYVDLNVDMPVTLKLPYVAGRTGRLVHAADTAVCRWQVNQHAPGFSGEPVLIVMPKCGKPWNIKNPLVMDGTAASLLIFNDEERSVCTRCEVSL